MPRRCQCPRHRGPGTPPSHGGNHAEDWLALRSSTMRPPAGHLNGMDKMRRLVAEPSFTMWPLHNDHRICLNATGQKAGRLLLRQSFAVPPPHPWSNPSTSQLEGPFYPQVPRSDTAAAERVLALDGNALHAMAVYADVIQGVESGEGPLQLPTKSVSWADRGRHWMNSKML